MIDIIYNFINEVLFGNSTIPGKTELATLLTFATMILIFFVLVKLVNWAFYVVKPKIRR